MTDLASSARALRKARAKRLAIRFGAFVLAPTLIASIYYGCLASPEYESHAELLISSTELASAPNVARDYMVSREMLEHLAKSEGLIEHYQSSDYDWYSRLSSGASSEDTYEYYREHVTVRLHKGGLATLRVRAYAADVAQNVSQAIVAATNARMQTFSEKTAQSRVQAATQELARTNKQLEAIRTQLQQATRTTEGSATTPADPRVAQLTLDRSLAQTAYEQAFAAANKANAQAAHTAPMVSFVATPSLPTAASYPKPLWSIVTVFALALAVMVVVSSMIAGVREHGQF